MYLATTFAMPLADPPIYEKVDGDND